MKAVVAGAGIAGLAAAIALKRAGWSVHVVEKRTDLLPGNRYTGRSINFTLSNRGRRVLEQYELWPAVERLSVPLEGRVLHLADGSREFHRYGTSSDEVLFAIRRRDLHQILLAAAREQPGLRMTLGEGAIKIRNEEKLVQLTSGETLSFDLLIGADGAFSICQEQLCSAFSVKRENRTSAWVYREFGISAANAFALRLRERALHLWSRGTSFICAIPNPGGDWVANLIYERSLETSFHNAVLWRDFVRTRYGDLEHLLLPENPRFAVTKPAEIHTSRVGRWHFGDSSVLIGDACHAISPFLGQGMNAALEDALFLTDCVNQQDDLGSSLRQFQASRKPHTDALWELSEAHLLNLSRNYGSKWRLSGIAADLTLSRISGGRIDFGYAQIAHSTSNLRSSLTGNSFTKVATYPARLGLQAAHYLARPFRGLET